MTRFISTYQEIITNEQTKMSCHILADMLVSHSQAMFL